MDRCPASKDGRCTLKYAFGAWCNGYRTKCGMRDSVEWYANITENMMEEMRRTLGIMPNGRM